MGNINTDKVFEKLNEFIKRYYINKLIKGCIYAISILIIFFLCFAVLEYYSTFGVIGRTFLFWLYIILNFIVFGKMIIIPLMGLFKIRRTLSYKQASKIVGEHFPEIGDKLLNVLELSEISILDNSLIAASIEQKIKKMSPISFKNAINLSVNKKHLKWLIVPVFITILFFVSGKDYIITESSARIIKHNIFFEPKPPFKYVILNTDLSCKQFDDFLLRVKVQGNEIPKEVFINLGGNNIKMNGKAKNEFDHLFTRIHSDVNFQFMSGGYKSRIYTIKSLLNPKVVSMEIKISHPKYTKRKPEILNNIGDLIVSEGATVSWDIVLENSNNCSFNINETPIKKTIKKKLKIKRKIFENTKYSIISSNVNSLKDTLTHLIKIISDDFPKIKLTQKYDTVSRTNLFSGFVEDDYLISKLEFICEYYEKDSLISIIEDINIQKKNFEQFFHSANFKNLDLAPGKELTYYFKVWDNDKVNGAKSTSSIKKTYKELRNSELIKNKNTENKKTVKGLDNSLTIAKEIKKDINQLTKEIVSKKKIDWKSRKKLREILEKQKNLENQIEETQKINSNNLNSQKKSKSSIVKKQRQLEGLMKNVFSEEMKKLLEEMNQIMDEGSKEKLKDLLENIEKETASIEKELDRELELFKQLEFEQKLEETLNKILMLKKRQNNLKIKTKDQNIDIIDLIKSQKNISLEMDEVKKDLQDLRRKNISLENKNSLPKTQKIEEDIKQEMKESQNALEKESRKNSEPSQIRALEKITKLEKELQISQKQQEENKPIEDMESLRKILENLIKLSFDQEELIISVDKTNKNSPEFIQIVQHQNKLSNDSKIIEDSLLSLSKRVLEIQASINKEIESIKSNMQKSTKHLENREVGKAAKRQQYIMTSSNNLALLLSEILEQMQNSLENPSSNCNKPGNSGKPSLSEIKKAQKKLNKKLGECKKSGDGRKKGEKKSKELMSLSRIQAEIRRKLIEIRNESGNSGQKGEIDNIINKMQKSETDIINDKITNETIIRQENIFSRLLDVENSNREKDNDNQRQSIEWEFDIKNTNNDFLEYKKRKEIHEELLRTTPVQLAPFYKKKVNNYFNIILND